jgi:hypothetical protein
MDALTDSGEAGAAKLSGTVGAAVTIPEPSSAELTITMIPVRSMVNYNFSPA